VSRCLRILQLMSATTNVAVPQNRLWLRNLHEPLVEMGHDVVLLPAEEGRRARAEHDARERERFSEAMLARFRREHAKRPFDLFFAYLMDGMIDPAAIDEIRSAGVPTCNFSCNNVHQFDLVDGLSPHFDFNLHSERDVGDKFRRIDANPLWFPMAANPRYYHPMALPRTIDASFVGQCYARRPWYVLRVLTEGIDLQVYGPGWLRPPPRRMVGRPARAARRAMALVRIGVERDPTSRHLRTAAMANEDLRTRLESEYRAHLHEPVADDEMVSLYSRSSMSLGFLEVFDQHDPSARVVQHVHLREFEAPMCGACYVTNYSEELAEFFEPDLEVVMWRNEHELVEKVKFYLTHPAQAQGIRDAGLRRALDCHTYERRFTDLFRRLGLLSGGVG